MGYKFIHIKDPANEFSLVDITFEIDNNDLTLTQMLELMRDFLRACSYQVGNLTEENPSEFQELVRNPRE